MQYKSVYKSQSSIHHYPIFHHPPRAFSNILRHIVVNRFAARQNRSPLPERSVIEDGVITGRHNGQIYGRRVFRFVRRDVHVFALAELVETPRRIVADVDEETVGVLAFVVRHGVGEKLRTHRCCTVFSGNLKWV